jgi:MraZ protein
MFNGEYSHSIDSKGRITMPAKFREELGEECVVARGFEGCLSVYSMEEWQKLTDFLMGASEFQKEIRLMRRAILATAVTCSYDKQGRILISNELRNRGNLTKEVMIVGVGPKIELWDKEIWEEFNDISDDELSALAEGILNGNRSKDGGI